MNTSRFYGNPGPSSNKHSRFVTLAEAQEEAENRTRKQDQVLQAWIGLQE